MAENAPSIFNKKATEKLRSPDDLDKYVQVANPSVWVVLIACIALLVGLLAWGVFGSVTTSVSSTGVAINGKAMCFLAADDVAKVNVGDIANVNGQPMEVSQVATVPLSREEARSVLESDYLANVVVPDDWAYQVSFDGDTSNTENNVPLAVNITVERVAPIHLILGNNA